MSFEDLAHNGAARRHPPAGSPFAFGGAARALCAFHDLAHNGAARRHPPAESPFAFGGTARALCAFHDLAHNGATRRHAPEESPFAFGGAARALCAFDALLIVGFGGPEKPADVMPFLENVTRGRRIPRERLEEVAGHYYHFGGKSPINEQVAELIAALRAELDEHGPKLPVYLGNRNWDPYLAATVRRMKADGVRRALAFVTSAWSSYSSCRQYLDNIAEAQAAAGEGAPEIVRLRLFYNHPGFIEPMAGRVRDAFASVPEAVRAETPLLFTAHSIPLSMSQTCRYVDQLTEACGLVANLSGHEHWRLVYQSRSGPPGQPWLEPDIGDALKEIASAGGRSVVVAPIGFLSDHMEVLYDLDHEAKLLCDGLGLAMARAGTVGAHPRFVEMIRELIMERMEGDERMECEAGCCPAPVMQGPPRSPVGE